MTLICLYLTLPTLPHYYNGHHVKSRLQALKLFPELFSVFMFVVHVPGVHVCSLKMVSVGLYLSSHQIFFGVLSIRVCDVCDIPSIISLRFKSHSGHILTCYISSEEFNCSLK